MSCNRKSWSAHYRCRPWQKLGRPQPCTRRVRSSNLKLLAEWRRANQRSSCGRDIGYVTLKTIHFFCPQIIYRIKVFKKYWLSSCQKLHWWERVLVPGMRVAEKFMTYTVLEVTWPIYQLNKNGWHWACWQKRAAPSAGWSRENQWLFFRRNIG